MKILLVVSAFCSAAVCGISHAEEFPMTPSLEKSKAIKSRCLSDLNKKQCWVLKAFKPVEVPAAQPWRFTKIQLTELGTKDSSFVIGIAWEGEGGGKIQFAGPKGNLFAIGSISPDKKVLIENFADDSLMGLELKTVFNETDNQKIREKTLQWLNEVVSPFLEQRILNSAVQSKP